jgi:hypothetical protein
MFLRILQKFRKLDLVLLYLGGSQLNFNLLIILNVTLYLRVIKENFSFIYFFDMSIQEGERKLKLVTSVSLDVVLTD